MQIRFTPVRFREGYDMQEVDDLVDRCERALLRDDGSVTAQTLQQLHLTPTRMGDGYDMGEVDRFVDSVLRPLFTSPERFPYDPDRDYTGVDLLTEERRAAREQRAAQRRADKAARSSGSVLHPDERRPGLLSRLFGGGR